VMVRRARASVLRDANVLGSRQWRLGDGAKRPPALPAARAWPHAVTWATSKLWLPASITAGKPNMRPTERPRRQHASGSVRRDRHPVDRKQLTRSGVRDAFESFLVALWNATETASAQFRGLVRTGWLIGREGSPPS